MTSPTEGDQRLGQGEVGEPGVDPLRRPRPASAASRGSDLGPVPTRCPPSPIRPNRRAARLDHLLPPALVGDQGDQHLHRHPGRPDSGPGRGPVGRAGAWGRSTSRRTGPPGPWSPARCRPIRIGIRVPGHRQLTDALDPEERALVVDGSPVQNLVSSSRVSCQTAPSGRQRRHLGKPKATSSAGVEPEPIPSSKRPPERWSRVTA